MQRSVGVPDDRITTPRIAVQRYRPEQDGRVGPRRKHRDKSGDVRCHPFAVVPEAATVSARMTVEGRGLVIDRLVSRIETLGVSGDRFGRLAEQAVDRDSVITLATRTSG